jgi:hypothetical protein
VRTSETDHLAGANRTRCSRRTRYFESEERSWLPCVLRVTTVRAWDGTPTITEGAFADTTVPQAGFSVIEADDIDEVIRLVADTPCARAKGAIEIRPIVAINDFVLKPPIP